MATKPANSSNSLLNDSGLSSVEPGEKYLIATADDFGYAEARDRGIIECFNNGIITRASLLVNGSSASTNAVKLAQDNALPLGIHLNLTEGIPISGNENRSLRREGSPFFRGKVGFREALSRGEINMKHVKDEIEAQIKTFIKLVGCLPNHVDGHQHIHVLPEIRDIIAQAMASNSFRQIRIPLEPQLAQWFDGNTEFFNKVFEDAERATDVYKKYGIRSSTAFMGISLMGRHMNVERILETYERTLTNQRPSVCELMVHPGYACTAGQGGCGGGPDDFACSVEREHERKILCDSKLKRTLAELNVVLIS